MQSIIIVVRAGDSDTPEDVNFIMLKNNVHIQYPGKI